MARRAGSGLRGLPPVVAAFGLVLTAASLGAVSRTPVAVGGVAGCEGLSGRYVGWLRGPDAGLVVSSSAFPGARQVALDERGGLGDGALGPTRPLTVAGTGTVWALRVSGAPTGPHGCVAFDKERFTWEGDLVSYVRYLGGLLTAAQDLDPSVRALAVRQRTVSLEVGEVGAPKVRLSGPEGAMQGLGRWSEPVRHFFLPVVVGRTEDRVLVRILRNQGEPFGARSMAGIGWVLLSSDGEPVVSPTEPAFELRLLALGG